MNPPQPTERPWRIYSLRVAVLVVLVLAWEWAVHEDARRIFFFGSPTRIAATLWERIRDGSLTRDFSVTASEAICGFLLGNVVGTTIGLSLWRFPLTFHVSRPFIVGLGAAPVFALAPMVIIWFGTGFFSKVMIAAASTVFVALAQAHAGAASVDPRYLRLMESMKATRAQTFRKVIAPSALVWVMAAFRMNVGFALLGAFIGEFISSERGLGHLILVASGLFDTPVVLAGVFALAVLALLMTIAVTRIEQPLRRLIVRIF